MMVDSVEDLLGKLVDYMALPNTLTGHDLRFN